MGVFDTHGGYFAPQGYTKVNAGGSHEENPNGGVQLGVDPNGVPNMLEEGEPVYDDFVFSDNIHADGGILKEYNVPSKYNGKLYSEIVDDMVSEMEDRPLDNVSNTGLRAMLARVAEAQEQQKAREEQAALEAALAELTPAEREQLAQQLAAQMEAPAEQEQPLPQVSPQDEMAPPAMDMQPAEAVPELPMQIPEEMPVMACGGKMKKFDKGGERPLLKMAMRAAMNDNPAQMQAMGYDYDADGNIVAGDFNAAGPAALRKGLERAGIVGAATMLPVIPELRSASGAVKPSFWKSALTVAGLDTGAGLVEKEAERIKDRKAMKKPRESVYLWDPDWGKAPADSVQLDLNTYPRGGELSNVKGTAVKKSLADQIKLGLRAVDKSANGIKPVKAPTVKATTTDPVQKTLSMANTSTTDEPERDVYTTLPRYAGLAHNLFTAGVNMMQSPDKYKYKRMQAPQMAPSVPDMINPVYRPQDQNMIANSMLSSGAATAAALRNSGIGPNTAQALLALDNNISAGLGNAYMQAAQYNNDLRNNVAAQVNNTALQRANALMNAARLNNSSRQAVDYYNMQADMAEQQANNAAEQAWATAVSQPLDYLAQGLTGIGTENFNRNMIRSNPALLYDIDPDGWISYRRAMGGKLKKK